MFLFVIVILVQRLLPASVPKFSFFFSFSVITLNFPFSPVNISQLKVQKSSENLSDNDLENILIFSPDQVGLEADKVFIPNAGANPPSSATQHASSINSPIVNRRSLATGSSSKCMTPSYLGIEVSNAGQEMGTENSNMYASPISTPIKFYVLAGT
uniref:Uncharacterized protein n=1 Tax=Kalanchoe fedtschenkoi TaxID=63787 RepID=A0A7N0TR46_KALFE